MSYLRELRAQFGAMQQTLWLIAAVSAVPIAIVLALHLWKGVPVGDLTRDPIATLGGPVYTGFLSQVGLFFWAGAAAACLLAARMPAVAPDAIQLRKFFYASGLLSLCLGVDDAFLLHERTLPAIGVPEIVVYAAYAGITLSWLVWFRPVILKTEYLLLGIALLLFGGSQVIDALDPPMRGRILLEDGLKLVGLVTWLAYFIRTGARTASR